MILHSAKPSIRHHSNAPFLNILGIVIFGLLVVFVIVAAFAAVRFSSPHYVTFVTTSVVFSNATVISIQTRTVVVHSTVSVCSVEVVAGVFQPCGSVSPVSGSSYSSSSGGSSPPGEVFP